MTEENAWKDYSNAVAKTIKAYETGNKEAWDKASKESIKAKEAWKKASKEDK